MRSPGIIASVNLTQRSREGTKSAAREIEKEKESLEIKWHRVGLPGVCLALETTDPPHLSYMGSSTSHCSNASSIRRHPSTTTEDDARHIPLLLLLLQPNPLLHPLPFSSSFFSLILLFLFFFFYFSYLFFCVLFFVFSFLAFSFYFFSFFFWFLLFLLLFFLFYYFSSLPTSGSFYPSYSSPPPLSPSSSTFSSSSLSSPTSSISSSITSSPSPPAIHLLSLHLHLSSSFLFPFHRNS